MEVALFSFNFELFECFLLLLRIVKSIVRPLLSIQKETAEWVKF